jgi:DNA polymerase-3 subunit delta'
LVKFSEQHNYDLLTLDLKSFIKIIIKENYYKKDPIMKYMVFYLIEFYFRKLNMSLSKNINVKYSYFLRRISDTKTFNLDEESLFMEFEEKVLNG